MTDPDDGPRRADPHTRLIAIVLVVVLVLSAAPFLLNLFF